MFRPTITDIQGMCNGDDHDIYLIQSQYTKMTAFGSASGVLCILALNEVNIVAVTTKLVLHVGVIANHVQRHKGFMFPRRSGNARDYIFPCPQTFIELNRQPQMFRAHLFQMIVQV